MAIIDIDFELGRATIRFDKAIPNDVLNCGKLVWNVVKSNGDPVALITKCQFLLFDEFARDGSRIVPSAHPEKVLALVMPNYGKACVGFLVDGEAVYNERVFLTDAALRCAFDPIRLSTRRLKLPEKPGRVAVMTQTYNEGDMLLYWEDYYAKQVGYENLYVLNNASTDDSCKRLNPKTSVINMPVAPVDHDHFAQAQGYFQRFLLLKYDWVIKVDTDELLVCEGNLADTMAKTEPGTYTPELGIEVVHDTENEAPFDFAAPVGTQRKHFVRGTEFLIRPIISSVPTTWTSGNHMSHELASKLPGFYSVHLKYFDLDFLLSKNKKWAAMTQTKNEKKICAQISSLQDLDMQQLVDLSVSEIAERRAAEPIPVPDWFATRV
jgi:hypothetical protein